MKHLKFSILIFFFIGCTIEKNIMSSNAFNKKVNRVENCDQITYIWERNDLPLDGNYTINLSGGLKSERIYTKGYFNHSITYSKTDIIDKTIFEGFGNYTATVYNEKSLLYSLCFKEEYDSAIFRYKNNFLQDISYYKRGKDITTIIEYQPGKISVFDKSGLFDVLILTWGGWDIKCPYKLLMQNSQTEVFFDEIEIEINSRDFKQNYIFKLNTYNYTLVEI